MERRSQFFTTRPQNQGAMPNQDAAGNPIPDMPPATAALGVRVMTMLTRLQVAQRAANAQWTKTTASMEQLARTENDSYALSARYLQAYESYVQAKGSADSLAARCQQLQQQYGAAQQTAKPAGPVVPPTGTASPASPGTSTTGGGAAPAAKPNKAWYESIPGFGGGAAAARNDSVRLGQGGLPTVDPQQQTNLAQPPTPQAPAAPSAPIAAPPTPPAPTDAASILAEWKKTYAQAQQTQASLQQLYQTFQQAKSQSTNATQQYQQELATVTQSITYVESLYQEMDQLLSQVEQIGQQVQAGNEAG